MRKRTLISLILTVIMILTASGIASAATWEYYFPITISDDSSTTRTMYPVILEAGGQNFVDGGYITANGTDCRLRTTADKNLMLSTDNIAFVVDSLLPYGQVTYNLYTGYSPEKSDYQIIVGDGGYVTVADNTTIELGDNFTITQSGWWDTTAGANKNAVLKLGAFKTYVSDNVSGDITSTIFAVDSLLLFTEADTNNKLTVTATTATGVDVDRDEDVLLYYDYGADYFDALDINFTIHIADSSILDAFGGMAISNTVNADWSGFAASDITFASQEVAGVVYRLSLKRGFGADEDNYVCSADTDYYVTLSRVAGGDTVTADIYDDVARTNKVDTLTLDGYGATKYRYLYGFVNLNVGAGGKDWDGYVKDLSYPTVSVTASGVTSGEYIVTTTANTTHMWIEKDGVTQETVALGGVSVPDTTEDWTFYNNNVLPYSDNTSISVNGTLALWFRPNEMITSTTLPDRATSVANDGTITWGSNDQIIIAFGEMESYEATTSTASANVTGFHIPTVGIPTNWWGMTFDGSDLPFYPTFFDTATQTGIPLQTLYLIVVFAVAIAVATVTIVLTRSVVVGVAFYTAVMVYGANADIIAWWIIYVYLIMVAGIIFLSSRQAMGG